MLAIRKTERGMIDRTLPGGRGLALALGMVAILVSAPAQAIQYFNGPSGLGFDNSSLMLEPDYAIPTDDMNPSFPFEFVSGGVTDGVPVGLGVSEVINDTASMIDRTITFTVYNNDALSELMIVLSFLGPTQTDYSGDVIDVDIDYTDPMDVATWGPLVTYAGYAFGLSDFQDVGGRLVATREFRYTVDVPQGPGGPPALSVALTRNFAVPEPTTGLLLAGALLVAARTGRKRSA